MRINIKNIAILMAMKLYMYTGFTYVPHTVVARSLFRLQVPEGERRRWASSRNSSQCQYREEGRLLLEEMSFALTTERIDGNDDQLSIAMRSIDFSVNHSIWTDNRDRSLPLALVNQWCISEAQTLLDLISVTPCPSLSTLHSLWEAHVLFGLRLFTCKSARPTVKGHMSQLQFCVTCSR